MPRSKRKDFQQVCGIRLVLTPLSPLVCFSQTTIQWSPLLKIGVLQTSHPLVKRSSAGFRKGKRPHHTFCCPHKNAERSSRGKGIRRPRPNMLEFADCPFLIDAKVNADGSCVVTRAFTEHSGHPVSEQQFQKYRR